MSTDRLLGWKWRNPRRHITKAVTVKRAARPLVCKRIEVHARPCPHCQLHTHACMLHAARYLLHAAVAVASNRQAMPSHALHVSHHSRMSHVLSHVCCLHLGGCIEFIRMHRAHKHVAINIMFDHLQHRHRHQQRHQDVRYYSIVTFGCIVWQTLLQMFLVPFTSHANLISTLHCNATQYISTVCALGASDLNDQQHKLREVLMNALVW